MGHLRHADVATLCGRCGRSEVAFSRMLFFVYTSARRARIAWHVSALPTRRALRTLLRQFEAAVLVRSGARSRSPGLPVVGFLATSLLPKTVARPRATKRVGRAAFDTS